MPKRKLKFTRPAMIATTIGLIIAVGVSLFAISVSNILSSSEKRGLDSLTIFTDQTSRRLEDMLENGSNVLHQLRYDLGEKNATLTYQESKNLLLEYKDNWLADDVGFLFADHTAIGANGQAVNMEKWIDPLDVDGFAYGVCISDNRVDDRTVLSFVISREYLVDGKECVGLFMHLPFTSVDLMLNDTEYGNDENTFLTLIDAEGNALWCSDADHVFANGSNVFEDLETAKFESRNAFVQMQERLNLGLSGNIIYTLNQNKTAMAYTSLDINSWDLLIGISYRTLTANDVNYVVSFTLITSIVIVLVLSMGAAFYFMYRHRSAELKQQKATAEATQAISENKAKSAFMSRMSHELRTPLNGIIGMTELTTRYGDDPKKRDEYLQRIKDSSIFLLTMIHDILDISKIEQNKLELRHVPFNINIMCRSLAEAFAIRAAAKNLRFFFDDSGVEHEYFVGDVGRLKQIIANLLSNAIKFTDDGTVSCSIQEIWWREQNAIEIVIQDTGRGISPAYQEIIFQPFVQEDSTTSREQGGTGLGLAIAQSLVKMAGGEITLVSAEHQGSTFTVRMPLPVCSEEKLNQSSEEINLKGYHLLLAEDNALNAEIALSLLEDAGATIDWAKNGIEVVSMFLSAKPHTYDVILMDVQMPEMDGLQATKKIRSSNHPQSKTIPIIAMTANALQDDREKVLAAGMNDHLPKPIFIDQIYASIRSLCPQPHAEDDKQ